MTAGGTASPGQRLTALWLRLSPWPGGRWLFTRCLGWMVPYTGTIRSTILELEPGRCVAELRDRRGVRNHLSSVHAVALVNLGEMTSGLAMLSGLPPSTRGIVTGLEAVYSKKARGLLIAVCTTTLPEVVDRREHVVEASISDVAGDVVATVSVRWLLSTR